MIREALTGAGRLVASVVLAAGCGGGTPRVDSVAEEVEPTPPSSRGEQMLAEPLAVSPLDSAPAPTVEDASLLVPEPEPEPELERTTFEHGAISIRARIDARGEDGGGVLHVEGRIEDETTFVLERAVEPGACLLEELEPEFEVVLGDEERVVVDVRYSCPWGSTVRHLRIEHLVLLVDSFSGEAGVAYEGTGTVHDNRGLAVEADRRELYVEAGVLVVYRHSVAWCDEAALSELRGERARCSRSRRRLTPLRRIPLERVPVSSSPS